MTTTFCTSGQVVLKAGSKAAVLTNTQYNQLINEAEAALNVAAKIPNFNLIDQYSGMNSDVKLILEDGASSHAACGVVAYDPSKYGSKAQAAMVFNMNWTRYLDVVKLIKEKPYTDWMIKQT